MNPLYNLSLTHTCMYIPAKPYPSVAYCCCTLCYRDADALSSPSSSVMSYPSPSLLSQSPVTVEYTPPPLPPPPPLSPAMSRPRSPATTITTASSYRGKSLYADNNSTLKLSGRESKSWWINAWMNHYRWCTVTIIQLAVTMIVNLL